MSADRPTPPAPSPTPEEARLRGALDRVATARPVDEGWDAIVERLAAEADGTTVLTTLPGGPTGDRRRPGRPAGRRLALVAACIVAVAAIAAGVWAVAGRDDDPAQVTVTPPPAEATGWYVPTGLPDGWVLDSVGTDYNDGGEGRVGSGCPCRRWVWSDPVTTIVHQTATGSLGELTAGDTADPVEIGPDVTGFVLGQTPSGEGEFVIWERDGVVHSVQAREADGEREQRRTALVEAARDVWAHADDVAPRSGLSLAVAIELPDIRSYQTVVATLRNTATGRLASYGMSPTGFDVLTPYLFDRPTDVRLPGQDRLLERFGVNPGAAAGDADQYLYVGRWPGADVFVGRYLEPAPATPMHDEDLRAVAAALRPATAEEWKAFLDTATGQVDERARASAITDLIQRD